jgi:pimeloyl-ACP methyl ester carboxylesterase
MEKPKTKPGINSQIIQTDRLRIHTLISDDHTGDAVIFLHGNFSAAFYWQDLILKLPKKFYGIAPDIRGYGWTEDKVINATRGVLDWVEDLQALMDALEIGKAHLVGWSLGAAPIYRMMIDFPEKILSVTLISPVSPFGFGGTKGLDGQACYQDFAGCGGGLVNPEFVRLIKAGDRSSDNQNSPRNIINTFYYVPPFRSDDEEDLLTASLQEKIGDKRYPGDSTPSANWPFVSPGVFGPINAGSPKYIAKDVPLLIDTDPKPPVLWIYGEKDQIVSDNSMFDIPVLGKLGFIPGYPGEDVMPPQPMVGQTRAVLEKYKANGGSYEEFKISDAGHGAFIEKPDEFNEMFHGFLNKVSIK